MPLPSKQSSSVVVESSALWASENGDSDVAPIELAFRFAVAVPGHGEWLEKKTEGDIVSLASLESGASMVDIARGASARRADGVGVLLFQERLKGLLVWPIGGNGGGKLDASVMDERFCRSNAASSNLNIDAPVALQCPYIPPLVSESDTAIGLVSTVVSTSSDAIGQGTTSPGDMQSLVIGIDEPASSSASSSLIDGGMQSSVTGDSEGFAKGDDG